MSKQVSIDEKDLAKLIKLAAEKENQKRQEGSYHLYGNGKARLAFMYNKEYYRTTVEAKNEEEAVKKLNLFVEEVKKGEFINTNYTFAEFAQIWLDEKVRPNADERCVKKYIGDLNNRILPYIGNIKLKQLKRKQLTNYFDTVKVLKTNYKNRKENNTVKPDTVKKWKSIIHACLEYAVECEILPRNPCHKIKIKYTNTTDEKTIQQIVESKREKIHSYSHKEYIDVCTLLENEFNSFYHNNEISTDKKLRELGRRMIILLDLKTRNEAL